MAGPIDWSGITDDLLEKYGGPAPRYTSYPTAPVWGPEFMARDYEAALGGSSVSADTRLSVYVHIPFCMKRCLFCGCASDVSDDTSLYDAYLDALALEAETVASMIGAGAMIAQLHLGGGTPTVLDPKRLARLSDMLTSAFELGPGAELSVEAAPAVTTLNQVSALAKLGFNRLSLGVQDFAFEVQKAVDRVQDARHIRSLVEAARARGFGVNLDLMYGLPRQRLSTWEKTLDTVIDIRPDRLAVFGYAHVPWMRPHQKALVESELPGPEQRLALFRIAHDRLLDAGYVYIGMDHFALPEDALAEALVNRTLSRNFQGYTVKQSSCLIGLGATAISDLKIAFAQNLVKTSEYMDRVNEPSLATFRGMRTSDEDRLRRRVITELMCNLTLNIQETEEMFGIDFAEHFEKELRAMRELEDDGLVKLDDDAISVTARGRMFVRRVGMAFDAYLDRGAGQGPRFSRTL